MALMGWLALAVAVVAAARSTWSPCGLSMLSSITPMTEAGRGRRYRTTALWFVAGAILGGLTLGAGMAVLAAAVSALGLGETAVLATATVAALVAAASDARIAGRQLPFHTRQVNEDWLDLYRAWVYGAGFGWQIGVGLATYIMTAGVYLTIVLSALTGSPAVALAIGGIFGLVRGTAIFLGRGITSPDALVRFHQRFDAAGPWVRLAMIATEASVAFAAALALGGPAVAAAIGVGAATIVVLAARDLRPDATVSGLDVPPVSGRPSVPVAPPTRISTPG